jgi:hypothetical protein
VNLRSTQSVNLNHRPAHEQQPRISMNSSRQQQPRISMNSSPEFP